MTSTTTRTTTTGRNQALGAYGEQVAARHLTERGLVVLDRNWRCDEGELDLVLRDGDVLVACEVKTRTSVEHGSPHEAVTEAKLGRLVRLAVRSWLRPAVVVRWIDAHDVRPEEIRVDLVAVLRPHRGPALIEHVRGLV
jgi:putative endonuclease